MSIQPLNAIAGNAIIDRAFCQQLLDPAAREGLLQSFDLDPEERAFIATIRADTLHEFAAILDDWATRRTPPPLPFVDWRADPLRFYPGFDEGRTDP